MKVPEGRTKIAHRFNGGWARQNEVESRRDGRKWVWPGGDFVRPSGACSHLARPPTVKTVGYFRVPLPGLERAEHDALVALVDRVLAAQRAHPSADTAPLEREIDARVHRLYALTPEEI